MKALRKQLSFRHSYQAWDPESSPLDAELALKFRRSLEDLRTKLVPVYRFDLGAGKLRRYQWYLRVKRVGDHGFEFSGMSKSHRLGADELLDLTLADYETVEGIVEAVGRGMVGKSRLCLVHCLETGQVYIVTKSSWREYQRRR